MPLPLTRVITTAAAALLLAGAAASCSTSDASSTGSKGYVAGDGSVDIIKPADRAQAPDLSGESLDGDTIGLHDYTGKVVVLNVWASWCGPCRSEADDLAKAAKKLGQAAFIGINSRDDKSKAEAFVRTHDTPYPSLSDQDGSLMLPFYGLLNIQAMPSTIVVDQQGRVAATIAGPTTTITLVDLVHQIARES